MWLTVFPLGNLSQHLLQVKVSPSAPAAVSALIGKGSRMGDVPTPAGCRQGSSSRLRAHPPPSRVRERML